MSETKRFSGKVALVTGAGGDIGRAVAVRLAREGATVAVTDIAQEKLEESRQIISAEGGTVRAYQCDVTDGTQVTGMVDTLVKDCGRIDLLFNNAGYQGLFAPVHEYPEDDFARVMEINVLGAFLMLRAVSVQMARQKAGSIVNTASMAGVGGPPNMIAYGASKFAVVGITQSAAKDLAPHGIRVNAISPAFMGPGFMWDRQVEMQAQAGTQYFDSDPAVVEKQMIGMVPMRRLGSLEEIPGAVVFLLSDDASYITGINVPIAGGIL